MYQFGISFGTRCSLPASYSILINKYTNQNRKSAKFPSISLSYHNFITLSASRSNHEQGPLLLSAFVLESISLSDQEGLIKVGQLPGISLLIILITCCHYFFFNLGNL